MSEYNQYVKGVTAASAGVVKSTTVIEGIRTEPAVSAAINKIEPWETALYSMLSRVGGKVETVGQPEFSVQEQWPFQNVARITTAATATGTSLVVDNADWIIPDMVAINSRTGEQVLVTVVSTTTLTVTRAAGTTAGQAMLAGDSLVFTSTALNEGQDHTQLRARGTDVHTSYAQKFEQVFGLTDIASIRDYRGENEKDRLAGQAAVEFKKQIERAILLNEPKKISSGGLVRYMTPGLRHFAQKYNNIDMGGITSYRSLARALYYATRFGGSKTRIGIVSHQFYGELIGLPGIANQIQRSQSDTSYGWEIKSITFPGGKLNLVPSTVLDVPGFESEILGLDFNYLKLREFEPMKSKPIEQNGSHREARQIFRRVGLECKAPITTFRIYNLGIPGV